MSVQQRLVTRRRFTYWFTALGAAAVTLTVRPDVSNAHANVPGIAHRVVGSWRLSVFPPAGEPHPAMSTFAVDGTLTTANLPVFPAAPGAPFQTMHFSGGHGAWVPSGRNAARFTADLLLTDELGNRLGTLNLDGTATVSTDGQTISSEYIATFTDPTGQVVEEASGAGSFEGTRIVVGV